MREQTWAYGDHCQQITSTGRKIDEFYCWLDQMKTLPVLCVCVGLKFPIIFFCCCCPLWEIITCLTNVLQFLSSSISSLLIILYIYILWANCVVLLLLVCVCPYMVWCDLFVSTSRHSSKRRSPRHEKSCQVEKGSKSKQKQLAPARNPLKSAAGHFGSSRQQHACAVTNNFIITCYSQSINSN